VRHAGARAMICDVIALGSGKRFHGSNIKPPGKR
jgi:hypothetical protein